MNKISRDFLPDFKREPSTVCSFFTENCLFSVKLQIPRKLKKYQILTYFQKRAFYRLVYVMNRFQLITCNRYQSRFQCFGHDKGLMKHKSIPNLKSTRSPQQTVYLQTFLENQYPIKYSGNTLEIQ